MDLPLYKTMDRRVVYKTNMINYGVRDKNTLVHKGEGYTYIIQNTELPDWFKVGYTKSEKSFKDRIQSYKSVFPIGEWVVLQFDKVDDVAVEELRLKHYYRYCLKYEMGVNSREWFKGDPLKVKREYITKPKPKKKVRNRKSKNTIVKEVIRTKECKVARYSYKEAREFINNL